MSGAHAGVSTILSRWIDGARRHRLPGSTTNLLWLMRDEVEEVRPIPSALREKCAGLLMEMNARAAGAQIEEVKAVKEACGL